jgi:deazaflavin-dependent oxidoreductase (nitroreductase family)
MSGEYEPSPTAWVREHVQKIIEAGTTEGLEIQDRPVVLLTYHGAKTGILRKTPVMRVEHDGTYAAIASKRGAPANPAWYGAMLADPVIELQDRAEVRTYRAREVSGEEKATWWGRAVAAYPPYDDFQVNTERDIPVLVLEPIAAS